MPAFSITLIRNDGFSSSSISAIALDPGGNVVVVGTTTCPGTGAALQLITAQARQLPRKTE